MNSDKPLRVLVVEDSLTVRKRLCEVIGADATLLVVGEAGDGKQAIALCEALRPDVISMDMMMPLMSGLAATEYIMAHCPTPILVVSSSLQRGELFHTYDALAAGAVDVLEKPLGHEAPGAWEQRLLAALKLVARVRVITHLRLRLAPRGAADVEPAARERSAVIALGASTGGPGALVQVLSALPAPLAVPVLIVLHLGPPFAAAFADWLDAQVPHAVAFARDGQSLRAAGGQVLLAPPDQHLVLQHGRLCLRDTPPRHSCRPSVDELFESLARELGARVGAALLTGMGCDGAAGLLAIRRAGGTTLAQDEASSVVFGMPREALMLGAAERVLPLQRIGPALAAMV